MSTAPCLMWKPLSAILAICYALVGAVTVSYPPDTSHPGYVARCTQPTFAQLCCMVAKVGTKGTRAAAAPPKWLCHDPLDLWHQRHRWNTLSFTTTETWHQGHDIGPPLSATQMVWPWNNGPRPVSNLSQTFRFPALERKEGSRRHGLNVWRLLSISLA